MMAKRAREVRENACPEMELGKDSEAARQSIQSAEEIRIAL
jgi:hypothetical protein